MIIHRPLGKFDTYDLFPIEFVGISATFWHIYTRKENILVKRTSLNHFYRMGPGCAGEILFTNVSHGL